MVSDFIDGGIGKGLERRRAASTGFWGQSLGLIKAQNGSRGAYGFINFFRRVKGPQAETFGPSGDANIVQYGAYLFRVHARDAAQKNGKMTRKIFSAIKCYSFQSKKGGPDDSSLKKKRPAS
jgi:hypothetical protein